MDRVKVFLICPDCLSRNYTLTRRKDDPRRLELRKFCPVCNRYTMHKQSK